MQRSILALFLITLLAATGTRASDEKPNIVFILSDDQAWNDYGFMGNKEVRTPHLDRLAGRSLLFEQGYVASPLCRPSLASMATGRYPFDHGVTGNDVSGNADRAALDIPVQKEFHTHKSFIKELVANGYLAHQSGKWWEGSYQDGGFTHGMTHGDPKRNGRHGDAGLKIGRDSLKPITDFIDLAIEEKKPFLIWYAPFLPHTPHNPPERLLKKYQRDGRAQDVAKYYAMCEWFDETCGDLMGHIDKRGLTRETVVIYICDNGWAAASTNADDPHQKLWGGFAQRSKGSPFENGIRTPIMLSWPGHIEPKKSDELAHAVDLFPTIAMLANFKAPADLPGLNLLDEKAVSERKAVFGVTHAIHNMTPGKPDVTLKYLWCVEKEWKLMVRYPGEDITKYKNLHIWDTEPVRLYHIADDPSEKVELSDKHPDVVKRLKSKLQEWYQPSIEPLK